MMMMAKLKVLQYGDPVLRQVAEPVHKVSSKIQKLIGDMFETMYAQNGCGLAAPQVGVSKQIFVLDCSSETKRYGQMVFINPKIVRKKGACLSHEGCLSFPEVFVDVKRYSEITVRFQDVKGRSQEMTVKLAEHPLLCRAIQHEMDHLNGILFVDLAVDQHGADVLLKAKNLPSIDLSKTVVDAALDEAYALLENPVAVTE
jgi:peptide deformylase